MRPCPSAVAVWPCMGDGVWHGSFFGLALALLRSSANTWERGGRRAILRSNLAAGEATAGLHPKRLLR
jgi:hypothetical protein